MNLIESFENQYIKSDIPEFGPGDVVKVNTRIREGQKERIQAYEGNRYSSGTRWTAFDLYGPTCRIRCWKRTDVPASFSEH